MAGVPLNLLLGLSRVMLAMARRQDLPGWLAHVDERHASPRRAVVVTGLLIAGLVLIGNVETTWSFSAFTVLVCYALTNLSALRLAAGERRFPRIVALAGLLSCLAFWVEPTVWATGLGLIGTGLLWHLVARVRGRYTDVAGGPQIGSIAHSSAADERLMQTAYCSARASEGVTFAIHAQ